MAVRTSDKEALRRFIDLDPISNAVLAQRIFDSERETIIIVDEARDVQAVAVVELPKEEGETCSLAVQGRSAEAVREVLRDLPRGQYWLQLGHEGCFDVLRERMRMGWYGWAWLIALGKDDLRGKETVKTSRIDSRWAHKIASSWATDWNADKYVETRLEKGPSAGVFVEGELVAWGLTHWENDNLSMLGFLNVIPEYRGRGYGASITISLSRQAIGSGKIPVSFIYETNDPSLAVADAVGYKRVCRQLWGDGVTR